MTALPPSFRVEVFGAPPRKNRRHVHGKGGPRNSPEFDDFVHRLRQAWAAAGHPVIRHGRWRLLIEAGWKRKTELDDGLVVPLGDVDAPVSAVLDALQHCGVLDDDARVFEQASTKFYDPKDPRVIITLEVCDG